MIKLNNIPQAGLNKTEDFLKYMRLKREWGKLHHDLYTGKKKDNWIPFEEWKGKI
jgi:hypothetical protein